MKITQDNSGSKALEKLADQIKKSKLEVGFLRLQNTQTVRLLLMLLLFRSSVIQREAYLTARFFAMQSLSMTDGKT